MEAATYVSHCSPLLYPLHPNGQAWTGDYLRHDEPARVVEALGDEGDVRSQLLLLLLHPSLAKELLAPDGEEDPLVEVGHLLGDLEGRQGAYALLARCRRGQNFLKVDDIVGWLLLGQHPQQLRSGLVLGRQQGGGAHDVFQELDAQVLQVRVPVEVLKEEMIMMMMAVLDKDKEVPTCPCLVTQCLRTESTLMVAALDVIDIFLFAEARNASLFA